MMHRRRMSTRARGLTLIELLAALILLSMIMMGLHGWLLTIARGSETMTEGRRFHAAAHALLQRIGDDLLSGTMDSERPELNRPALEGTDLLIPTRSLRAESMGMMVTRRYVIDHNARAILVRETAPGQNLAQHMLGGVRDLACSLDESDNDRVARKLELTVTITSMNGRHITRTWVLP